jgi:hypothetical protein
MKRRRLTSGPLWAVAFGAVAAAGLILGLFAAERLLELWRFA